MLKLLVEASTTGTGTVVIFGGELVLSGVVLGSDGTFVKNMMRISSDLDQNRSINKNLNELKL